MAEFAGFLRVSEDPSADVSAMCSDDVLISKWLDSMETRGLRPKTLGRRRYSLQSLRRHSGGSLGEASVETIEKWLREFDSLETRKSYHTDAMLFFRWATRRGYLQSNPAEQIEAPRPPKLLPRPLTADEVGTLRALPLDRNRSLMIRLGLFAGLRVSEIAALRWENVSLRDGTLTVRAGKGNKDRAIPLHPELVALLAPPMPRGPVVVSRKGGHLGAADVSSHIGAVLAAVGIAATAHQLRHTFGTEAARASNGNLLLVATLMGHESTATTRGYVLLGAHESAGVIGSMWATAPRPRPSTPHWPGRRCHR